MKQKIYKRRIYWFSTTKGTGALGVDQDGIISKWDSAPFFRWMSGRRFVEVKNMLRKRNQLIGCKLIDTEVDPF